MVVKYEVGDIVKVVSESELKKLNDLSWKHFRENHLDEVLNFNLNIIPPEFAEKIMMITSVESNKEEHENIYGAETNKCCSCGLRNEAIHRLANEEEIIHFNKNIRKSKIEFVIEKISSANRELRNVSERLEYESEYIKKLKKRMNDIKKELNGLLEQEEG